MICLSEPSFEAVRKRYVTYGLGADISLSLCLAERPGVWKLCKLIHTYIFINPLSEGHYTGC